MFHHSRFLLGRLMTDKALFDISESLRFDTIQYFLKSHGWNERESKYHNISIFEKTENDELLTLKAPKSNKNIGLYASMVSDLICGFSEYSGADPDAVAVLLKQERVDLHRLHLPLPRDVETAINLKSVKSTVDSFYGMLYEAMLEVADTNLKERADQFRGACLFGHTFKGSFGISIETPTNLFALSLFDYDCSSSFERLASLRISTGLEILSSASLDGGFQKIEDSLDVGLSPAMCKSLLGMRSIFEIGGFEYEAYWSPFMPRKEINSKVRLDRKSIPILERASEISSDDNREIRIEFVGSVEKLQASRQDLLEAEPDSNLFKFGIRGRSRETGNAMISFSADRSTYEKALSAHEKAQEVVASCVVKKRSRGWAVVEFLSLAKRAN